MQTETVTRPTMKKFQVRQAGPIRLTSAATPLYNDMISRIICGVLA